MIIRGGSGNDTLKASGGTVYGDSGRDTLTGLESFLYGGGGNDVLDASSSSAFGGAGNNTLVGDIVSLFGGTGNDVILIDPGDDFEIEIGYLRPNEGIDRINGFDFDQLFNISAPGFAGGLQPGSLSEDQFVLGSSAQDAEDRFIYSITGRLFYDPNGTGSAGQVQLANLTGAPP